MNGFFFGNGKFNRLDFIANQLAKPIIGAACAREKKNEAQEKIPTFPFQPGMTRNGKNRNQNSLEIKNFTKLKFLKQIPKFPTSRLEIEILSHP